MKKHMINTFLRLNHWYPKLLVCDPLQYGHQQNLSGISAAYKKIYYIAIQGAPTLPMVGKYSKMNTDIIII